MAPPPVGARLHTIDGYDGLTDSISAPLLLQHGSGVFKAGSGMHAPGSVTPGRGRRQLPQTPLTPRPAVAYKTANSSPMLSAASASRFSHGLSEHERLFGAFDESPIPVTRIGSDPNLSRQPEAGPHQALLEESEDFQDTVSSHGGRSARTTPTSSASSSATAGTAAAPVTVASVQARGGVVANGYHFTLGVNSASGGRAGGSLREREEEDWC